MSKKEELKKAKKLKEIEEKAGEKQVRSLAKATEERDANIEKQQIKRYKDAPLSNSKLDIKDGILSKGTFSLYVKNKNKYKK